jgi:hypothetical protein
VGVTHVLASDCFRKYNLRCRESPAGTWPRPRASPQQVVQASLPAGSPRVCRPSRHRAPPPSTSLLATPGTLKTLILIPYASMAAGQDLTQVTMDFSPVSSPGDLSEDPS